MRGPLKRSERRSHSGGNKDGMGIGRLKRCLGSSLSINGQDRTDTRTLKRSRRKHQRFNAQHRPDTSTLKRPLRRSPSLDARDRPNWSTPKSLPKNYPNKHGTISGARTMVQANNMMSYTTRTTFHSEISTTDKRVEVCRSRSTERTPENQPTEDPRKGGGRTGHGRCAGTMRMSINASAGIEDSGDGDDTMTNFNGKGFLVSSD
jgi:hypothetical protein